MSRSRIQNVKRNMESGIINSIVAILLPFISRTIVIKVLGAEYLGLGSLFISILQVLSMAELGFSSVIVFSLYKPIAIKDKTTVCALLSFYREIYRTVGIIILIFGIATMPFLRHLIHGDVPQDINIYILYFIYLLNTSVSYLAFAYKSSLLIADQRQDVINNINTVLRLGTSILQIIVLLSTHNYYIYTGILLTSTICNNVLVAVETKKRYPEYVCKGEIELQERKDIIKQVKGLAIGRVSRTARNSFDSIILSMFCGLIDVAIYSNYYYVFNAVLGFIGIIITSISAGVGNSIATESLEKNYRDFKKVNFYVAWFGSWCTICLFCLYQNFMKLWSGESLTASNLIMTLFCIYFYISQVGQVRAVYASAAGIWWEFRWLSIGEMIANLLLNFGLGYYFEMAGIIVATIITVFFFSIIGISMITFKHYFKRSSKEYQILNAIYVLITIIVALITQFVCNLFVCNIFKIDSLIISLIIRSLICLILPNYIFFILCKQSSTHRQYLQEFKRVI